MKNFFAILAMICMVAIAVPAMAVQVDTGDYYWNGYDYIDRPSNQFQGGINIYIENGAADLPITEDLAAKGSANIVAGQASRQEQENRGEIRFCNKVESYDRDYNYNNDDYHDLDFPSGGDYKVTGQEQTWHQELRFNTGYGMAEMIQHGTQSGMSVTANIIATPIPDGFFDDDVKILD